MANQIQENQEMPKKNWTRERRISHTAVLPALHYSAVIERKTNTDLLNYFH